MASILDLKPTLSSLGIPTVSMSDNSDSKLASPTDSDNAEKNLAELDNGVNGGLHLSTEEATKANEDPLFHDAAANSAIAKAGPRASFSSDPLSATALVSPLQTLSWDSIVAAQGGSLDAMLANGAANKGSWDNFKRVGPRYPPSLEKLVMDYHHRHSKSWQLAHDMGAGSGVYSPTLARYFRHVHVSDPSQSGSSTSRKLLSGWAAENKKSRGRFTFSVTVPERGHESMADGTADLAIVMQGAHFTDPTALVLSAAESLATNGTLALISFSPICRITGNPRADAAAQQLFTAWGSAPWDIVCGDGKGKQKFGLGLDFVPLPDHLFAIEKTRRIAINGGGGSRFAVPGTVSDASESRVRHGERRHEYTSEDEQGKGWRQEVGPEFFRSMTAALLGSAQTQKFEKNFKEIESIVHETSPNGIMINVEWTVAVVLATKT